MNILEIRDVDVYYGEGHILHGIDMSVEDKGFVGVIGRNGVGKTTLLKSIIGLLAGRSGSIKFRGIETVNLQANEICRLGIGYVPQGREIFSSLTVYENLRLGRFSGRGKGRSREAWDLVYGLFPVLKSRRAQKGSSLSGGEQQMLAIARALLSEPQILLLDEPNEGLAPFLIEEIENRLRLMNNELGLSIILVEQNIQIIFDLVSSVYLMERGTIIKSGRVEDIKSDETVRVHLTV